MDLEQFLAWEGRQESRHEYDGVRIIAMTGGTDAHSAIQMGLAMALGIHLKGKPCRPRSSDLKIRTATSIRHADALVVCAPRAPTATFVADPVVIFEILGKSTAREDYGPKVAEYQSIPSLQRYVILQQTHRAAIVFSRTEEGWDHEFMFGVAAVLAMPEIGIAVPLAEIYDGIALESDSVTG